MPHFYPAQQRVYESTVLRQNSPLGQPDCAAHSAHPLAHTLPLDAGHLDVGGAVGGSQHLGFPTGSALLDLEALQQLRPPPMCLPPIAMQNALLQPSLAGALGGSDMPRRGLISVPLVADAPMQGSSFPQLVNPLQYAYASTDQQYQQQQALSAHRSPESDTSKPSEPPASGTGKVWLLLCMQSMLQLGTFVEAPKGSNPCVAKGYGHCHQSSYTSAQMSQSICKLKYACLKLQKQHAQQLAFGRP